MIRGGAAYFSIMGRLFARSGCALACLLLVAPAQAGTAQAADSVDCARINLGRLDVALAPGSSALRTVEMNQGDTLAFTFRADAHARGTITLITREGRERKLLYGANATQISYTAEQTGPVGFRLATKGGRIATFMTTCTPATASGATTADGPAIDLGTPSVTVPKDKVESSLPTPTAPGLAVGPSLQWLGHAGQPDAQAGAYGVKLKLQPAILVGVTAQFDPSSGDPQLGPLPLSEQSWMAGPVTSLQIARGLSLDARAAWGPTDPGVSPLDHSADRQLLDARLVSKQESGSWRFSPTIGLSYLQEKLDAAAAAPLAEIAGQHAVESGRFDIRPEMAYRIDMGDQTFIEPRLMVGAFWDIGALSTPGAIADGQGHARHMAETGFTLGIEDGTKFQLGGAVEEGAPAADDIWSGRLQLDIPLK